MGIYIANMIFGIGMIYLAIYCVFFIMTACYSGWKRLKEFISEKLLLVSVLMALVMIVGSRIYVSMV